MPSHLQAVGPTEAELHILKVEKLDACIRPLFTNSVTNIDYQLNHERAISYYYMGATRLTSMTKLEHMATLSTVLLWEVLYD